MLLLIAEGPKDQDGGEEEEQTWLAEEGTPQEGSSNEELDEETLLMASMGLPVQFGSMSARKQCAVVCFVQIAVMVT